MIFHQSSVLTYGFLCVYFRSCCHPLLTTALTFPWFISFGSCVISISSPFPQHPPEDHSLTGTLMDQYTHSRLSTFTLCCVANCFFSCNWGLKYTFKLKIVQLSITYLYETELNCRIHSFGLLLSLLSLKRDTLLSGCGAFRLLWH